jgi:spore coat protein CotF
MGETNVGLTSTEISNIWSSYLKGSMELRFFQYFQATAEDPEVRNIVEKLVDFSQKSLEDLKAIFIKENLTIPLGFTEKDVRLDADRVFSDTFILYICHDITMLSLSTYPAAFPDCTRKDIRNFFQNAIEFTIKIQNEITELMLSQGIYLKSPQVALDHTVDLVDEMKYLNGLFGGSRPVNAAEIANLSRVIHRARFSKMILVTFSKLASHKDVKQHFSKGRDALEKVLETLGDVFEKENIPYSASGDYNFFEVRSSPFSDKLMLFFVNTCLGMFCFIMINQALTSSLRTDIVTKFTMISNQMKKFYGKGLLLTITEKWLEQPPQALDRKV